MVSDRSTGIIDRRWLQGEGEDVEEEEGRWPPWLRPLLATSFFAQCKLHPESHRSECNMYCLDCAGGALCSLCLACCHRDHRAIQIRRSSYHDVIRVSEIQKLVDVAGVQTYVINSARVVFLNERPQQRGHGGRGAAINACEVCNRTLLDSFRFCSLGCKIAGTSDDNRRNNKKRSISSISDSDRPWTARTDPRSLVFRPSLPSGDVPSCRSNSKRRKGIPKRAPLGSLLLWY